MSLNKHSIWFSVWLCLHSVIHSEMILFVCLDICTTSSTGCIKAFLLHDELQSHLDTLLKSDESKIWK